VSGEGIVMLNVTLCVCVCVSTALVSAVKVMPCIHCSLAGPLMLLVGQQEGHTACKSSGTTIPKSLLLGTGLIWSDLTWSNSGKMGRLNKNECECVYVCVCLLMHGK